MSQKLNKITFSKFILASISVFSCYWTSAFADLYKDFRHTTSGRVMAIGDLHGDLIATKNAFMLAGAIDSESQWIGKNLTIVQVGDQIDKGDDDFEVLEYLESMKAKASLAGSKLIILNGNHEFMNVNREFGYVSDDGFKGFLKFAVSLPHFLLPDYFPHNEPGSFERSQAFSFGGHYSKILANRPFFAIVNDTVFVHGGINTEHIKYGLPRMQEEAKAWMEGRTSQSPILLDDRDLMGGSPIWHRIYSSGTQEPRPTASDCEELSKTLLQLDSKRMVVGHTAQFEKGINSACDNHVWRVDIGLSRYYDNNGRPQDYPVQVLEIEKDQVSVLRAKM